MKVEMTSEEAMNRIQKIFKKRGRKALDIARKEMLKEKIESKEARRALTYFMTKYWRDLARPSLMSMVCEAVGGDPELTTPIAVSMILISGAIDIHDDIIDESRRKDGRVTVYGKFGKDVALLIGDALLFKGLSILGDITERELPSEKATQVIDIVKTTFFELGDAEALELRLRHRLDVSPEEYLHVVRKKAADVEAHTRIGAVLGNASNTKTQALAEYGRLLGMMIILRDDWLDTLEADELRNRIKKESLPLPLLYGIRESKMKAALKSLFEKKTLKNKDVERIVYMIQGSEALHEYRMLISELAQNALLRLEKLKYVENLKLLVNATISP